MSSMDEPWLKTEAGWTAFASDLQLEQGKALTPQGEPIDVSDARKWQKQRDAEGELLEWRHVMPDGKRLTIFND